MAISPQQAADALHDIAQTENRSRELRGYQQSSPILILWGLIWIVGYSASGYSPEASIIWLPLTAVGGAGTVFLSRRRKTEQVSEEWERRGRKIGFSWLVLMAFWVSTYAIMRPHEPNQFAAFPALVMAAAYTVMGIWAWPRYLWLGIALFICTASGYFFMAPLFCYWMAAVGGGALILGGLWLRKA